MQGAAARSRVRWTGWPPIVIVMSAVPDAGTLMPLGRSTAFAGSPPGRKSQVTVPAAAPALAAPEPVSDVRVAVDLGAVTNTAAAQRFATLDTDLKNALMTRLVDRIGPDGLKIEIDISEVEPGMVFFEDLHLASGALLIARGQEVTPGLASRLRNIGRGNLASTMVRLLAPREPAA